MTEYVSVRDSARCLLSKTGTIVLLALFSTACFFFEASWVDPSSVLFIKEIEPVDCQIWIIQFIISFFALCALGAIWKRANPVFNPVCVGLSLAMAVCVLAGRCIINSETLASLIHPVSMLALDVVLVAGYALPCYVVLSTGFDWLVRATESKAPVSTRLSSLDSITTRIERAFERVGMYRHPMRVTFAVVLVCWTPLFVLYFPGAIGYDLAFQLSMAGGVGLPLSDHNPFVSTLLFYGFIEAGKLVGSPEAGLALLTIVSCCSLASVVGLIVSRLVATSAPAPFVAASIGMFGILPIWQFFAVTPYKDVFFTVVIVWFFVSLWDAYGVLVRGGSLSVSTVARLCAAIALSPLFKSTALLVVVVSLIALLVAVRLRKAQTSASAAKSVCRAAWCGLATVFVVQLALAVTIEVAGIEQHRPSEALSVPIQQTARFMTLRPDDVTDEERDALYRFYDAEKLFKGEYVYTPAISDPVKWATRDNLSSSDIAAFLLAWVSMGTRDPLMYLDAFVATTYGFFDVASTGRDVIELVPPPINMVFDPSAASLEQLDTSSDGRRQLQGVGALGCESLSSDVYSSNRYRDIFTMMLATCELPPFAQLQLPPFSVWAVIASAVYVAWRRQAWLILALAPGFACMFVLAISPCVHVRYALPLMLASPLVVWLVAFFAGEASKVGQTVRKGVLS